MIVLTLYLFLAALVFIYFKLNKKYDFWSRKGIPQLKPVFLYGDAKDFLEYKISEGELIANCYRKFKKMGVQHGGIYYDNSKAWIPVDLQLIKNILIKDFTHFNAHFFIHPINTLYLNNIFHMIGEPWKDMRRKLTPVFTTGKMKMMYDIILDKILGLSELINDAAKSGKPLEIKTILARCTTDIIGSCGFGLECNSLKDEQSEFFRQGQNIIMKPIKINILLKRILSFFGLVNNGYRFSEIEDFFRGVVKQTLKYREENKIVRKDFIHLMLQLKNKGVITELSNEKEDVFVKTVEKDGISLEDITGQALLFFSAGYETSSTTMAFALLELTQNQEVQRKLRKEVRIILEKYNGNFTYEALQEMTYCENVVNETLRKYPPLALLPRTCTQNYTIPGTNIVIERGTIVKIPAWGIQTDPEYFPDPEVFDPDRFSPENKSKIKPMTFIPFGEGPRQCLGMRFGMVQSKLGLAVLVKDYNFTLNKDTPYPPKFIPTSLVPKVEGGIMLDVTKID